MKSALVLCLLVGLISAYPRDLTCRGVSKRNGFELKDCSFDQNNSTISCKTYIYLQGTQRHTLALEMTSTFFPLINDRYSVYINRTTYDTCLGIKSTRMRKVDRIPPHAPNVFTASPMVMSLQESVLNFSANIEVNSNASVGFLANLQQCSRQQERPCSPQIVVTSFIVNPGADDDFGISDIIHGNVKKFYIEKMNARVTSLKLQMYRGVELLTWLPYLRDTNVQHLDVDNNQVQGGLEYKMEGLGQLETLSMRNCQLDDIADRNFQQGATNLKQLDLSQNKLSEVPYGIRFLRNLRELNLAYQTPGVPKFILRDVLRNLSNLRVLNISHTPLYEITRLSLPNASNLEILDLSYCKLSTIPGDLFVNMRGLKHIYLNGNELKKFHPDTFKGLRQNTIVHLDKPMVEKVEPIAPNVDIHPEHSSSSVVRYTFVLLVSLLVLLIKLI